MVLLKQFGPEGFTFFTNYESRKARQLSENSRAALLFYWPYLYRQVRIEGIAERVSRKESEDYFRTRPRLSQVAAAISRQSEVIPSRAELMHQFRSLQARLAGGPVPFPDTWGGFRVVPDRIEFWLHRDNRLHMRWQYRKDEAGAWTVERLSP